MTNEQKRNAINVLGVSAWNLAVAAGKQTITVDLANDWSGTEVIGATGTLRTQLLNRAGEIRAILMDECEENFPDDQGVTITVNGTVPSPALPRPPQFPAPPPTIIQPLPVTVPIATGKIYYV